MANSLTESAQADPATQAQQQAQKPQQQ